jgi:hypothetical protein
VVSFLALVLALVATIVGAAGAYSYLPILSELAVLAAIVAVGAVFVSVVLLWRGTLVVLCEISGAAGGMLNRQITIGLVIAFIVILIRAYVVALPY